jgi:hypothetical protein
MWWYCFYAQLNMTQNIYKQAKIKNCKTSKDIKLQNIYKQTKRECCKTNKQR